MITWKRLLPERIAGRFALLLTISLVSANLLALAVLSYERLRLDRAALIAREQERIVSLIPALEAAFPQVRPSLANSASTRSSEVTVGPTPLVKRQGDTRQALDLADALTEALGGRDVRTAVRVQRDDAKGGKRMAVAASVHLVVTEGETTQWLNIRSRGRRPSPPWIEEGAFLLILGLSLAAILAVGLIFVRRLTDPLTELAKAARAAGRGDRTVLVQTEGPREIQDAATAFNDMQARIARFDAERMRMLAAVGHDLRTPITSLRIRAEMLEPDEGEPMISTLEEMTVMADELVAYARGTGESEALRDVDIHEVVERACAERGVPFKCGDPATVRGRPVALGRAFGNLLDNALKYGNTARVMMTLDADAAVVEIDDDGPGISREKRAEVFNPFVRGDQSRNPDTGGAGLGLAIVRDVIAAHGGSVTLDNLPEAGLRATVRLPIRR
ncbi:HAMP domain-containing protein [Tateyamaria omphalii]|uniref:ATP-binding protein n=1 Tax=Tateyamaria omphalii TaxID=299262 RepID=UPI001C996EAE|nr:ATP-binding protein [Tateyamaria omphalii]MBY5935090.1 HAMP domain-containing protein [Tateyamaria omphalii]